MKNRERFITNKNEYDMMMAIWRNTGICPIRALAGISAEEKIMRCYYHVKAGCGECVQAWLNEGGK